MNVRRDFSRIEIEASEWLVTLSDAGASADERARFQHWLAVHPEHRRIYDIQRSVWGAIPEVARGHAAASLLPAPRGQGVREKLFGVKYRHRRRVAYAAAATLLLSFGLFWRATHMLPFETSREFSTRIAQVRALRLTDGTRVTLGARSRLEVEFTGGERRAVLTGGEAFFDVTRDPRRPFIVTAGDTRVRVLGTQFDVHHAGDAVRVAVLEGRVAVSNAYASPAQPGRTLVAGQSITARKTSDFTPIQRVDSGNLAAWRSGRLMYVDARLRDVVADINRYYNGRVIVADARAGDLQLTVAFRVDQIDRMLEVLASAVPIDIQRIDDKLIVLSSAPPPGH